MKAALVLVPLVVLALTAPALAAPGAPTAPVAMEDLVGRALTQSPTLRAARTASTAADSREQAANSPYWPQVALSTSTAQTTSVSPAQTVSQPFNLSTAGLSVRQTLWTFGKLDASVEQAAARAAAARHQIDLTAVDVAFGVRQAYLGWAQASGLESQAVELLRYAEATRSEANARFRTGVAARLDVTRAETSVALAKASLASAKAATAQARRSLSAAIGQNTPIVGEPKFPETPEIARTPLSALEAAALQHPDMRVAQAQLDEAAAVSRAAEAAGLPDLNADGSYGIRARDFQGVPNFQAGVSMNWPLFTGFAVSNQAEAARAQAEAVEANLAARRLTLLRDVDNAYLALEGAKESVPAAKAAVDAARANLAQAQGRYRSGVGSIIEVADAQSLLASAQGDWVRSTTSYHLAIAGLQRALGTTGVRP